MTGEALLVGGNSLVGEESRDEPRSFLLFPLMYRVLVPEAAQEVTVEWINNTSECWRWFSSTAGRSTDTGRTGQKSLAR